MVDRDLAAVHSGREDARAQEVFHDRRCQQVGFCCGERVWSESMCSTNSWNQKQKFSRELTVERDMVVAVADHEDRVGRLVPLEGGFFCRGAARVDLVRMRSGPIDPGILLTQRRSLL
jgi:hypothetical protein